MGVANARAGVGARIVVEKLGHLHHRLTLRHTHPLGLITARHLVAHRAVEGDTLIGFERHGVAKQTHRAVGFDAKTGAALLDGDIAAAAAGQANVPGRLNGDVAVVAAHGHAVR
ncbi:hypothetical protein CAI21_21330, partial [Alkalilimnicola ehrlichii]|uniref:hypothetical protein n=1 Tax=Alkalilimnicola ehrlichii TaxID=351052 RepID=UPI000E375BAE